MAESIHQAYLVSIQKFEDNDHVLNFILDNNCLVGMLSKGSQKTLSKNGRLLLFKSLFEIEFFASRLPNKLSRLKKINPINMVKLDQSFDQAIIFLNDFLIKNQIKNFPFEIYKQIVESTFKYNAFTSILIIIKNILILEGININVEFCIVCKEKNIYHFMIDKLGFVCKNCFNEDINFKTSIEINKAIFYLFKKKYDLIDTQENELKFKLIKLLTNLLYESTGVYLDTNFL